MERTSGELIFKTTNQMSQRSDDERALIYKRRNEQLQKICKKYNMTNGHVYHLTWNMYVHPHYKVKFMKTNSMKFFNSYLF